jgi:hypothetical protein
MPWVARRKLAQFADNSWQLTFWMLMVAYPQVSRNVLRS